MNKIAKEDGFGKVSLLPSKKFVMPKKIAPGMFYYADGLIFPELIKDNQVSAIVGCVDRNHGLAIALRETVLPWSSDWLNVKMPLELSGKEATSLILKTAKEKQENAEAAEWCAEYAFDGIKAGTGFLPSKEELKRVFANRIKLCEALVQLDADGVQEACLYLSSSEHDSTHAWLVRSSDGHMTNDYTKYYSARVRCVIEFKI